MHKLDSARLHRDLEERLRGAFQAADWEVITPSLDHGYDLCVERGGVRYLIEIKSAKESRRPILEALLAKALLQSQHHAQRLQAQPLPIVGTPLLTDRMVADLKAFMRTYAPETAYGLIDLSGRLELDGPGLGDIRSVSDSNTTPFKTLAPAPDLFSELNQWLLKVLLAPRLEPALLEAPRRPLKTATDLAQSAQVSIATATRFVSLLERNGYLDEKRRALEPVRCGELFKQWARAPRRPRKEQATRFLLSTKVPHEQLTEAMAQYADEHYDPTTKSWSAPRACLASFSAAERLGLGFVQGVPEYVHVESLSARMLEELGLIEVAPGERTEVVLLQPSSPEAVFRAMSLDLGAPTADVIQTWLDVADHPARGQEQAGYIWDRVLRGVCVHP